MRQHRPTLALACLVVCAACASTDVARLDTSWRRERSPESVRVLLEIPQRSYSVIAIVEVDDQGWGLSLDNLIGNLQREAAKLGGDAVILGEQSETSAGAYFMPVGDSWIATTITHKKLLGHVIVYEDAEVASSGDDVSEGVSSGSGIIIGREGVILTNAHVVTDSCPYPAVIFFGNERPASILFADDLIDLAVLRATLDMPHETARLRAAPPPRVGEAVIAVGFPFRGLLSSGATVTTGSISALAGIDDDPDRLQISAPVQPGSSGGPLVDQSGNVIGVVVSSLDALAILEMTGALPENVNFAIKVGVVRSFLDSRGLAYDTANAGEQLLPEQVAEMALGFTVAVECREQPVPFIPTSLLRKDPLPDVNTVPVKPLPPVAPTGTVPTATGKTPLQPADAEIKPAVTVTGRRVDWTTRTNDAVGYRWLVTLQSSFSHYVSATVVVSLRDASGEWIGGARWEVLATPGVEQVIEGAAGVALSAAELGRSWDIKVENIRAASRLVESTVPLAPDVSQPRLILESVRVEFVEDGDQSIALAGRTVTIRCLVTAQGAVANAKVYRLDPEVEPPDAVEPVHSAIESSAVGLWRFHPATKDGDPVPVWHIINIRFGEETGPSK